MLSQDKTWVRDPDGNEWEVFVVLQDNLAETAPCDCGTKADEGVNAQAAITPAVSGCCAPTAIGMTHEISAVEARCC